MAEAQKFRETLLRIVPPFLRNGQIGRILYTWGLHVDALGDWAINAVRARYPGAPNTLGDARPIIGKERKIIRGKNEIDWQYDWRLWAWLDHARTRGNAYALLRAFHAYYQDYLATTSGAGAARTGAGALAIPMPSPSGRKGSLLIGQVYHYASASHATPVGWTPLRAQTTPLGDHHRLYARISDGTETAMDLTVTGTGRTMGRIYRFEGQFVDLADEVRVLETLTGSSDAVTQPSVQAPELVRAAFVGWGTAATITAFPGWIEIGDGEYTVSPTEAGIGAQIQHPDVTQVAGTATLGTSVGWGVISLSLRPRVGSVGFGIPALDRCVELIYRNGLRYSLAINGTVTRDHITWLSAPHRNGPHSWWLVIHTTVPASDGEWDDPGTWDDGGVWDSSISVAEMQDWKLVPNAENARHSVGYLAMIDVSAEATDYDPEIFEDSDAAFAEGVLLLPMTPGAKL